MSTFLPAIEAHLQQLIAAASGFDDMWPSVLDVRTGQFPEGEHVPRRVYRLIGAPRGSTLYWDQPMLLTAGIVSELTKNPHYGEAASRYVNAFLATCVAEDGMFQWGNHVYYDVFERAVIPFSNGYHELRPITPAWDIFYRHAAEPTMTYVKTMVERHIYDPVTGGFNRHDDQKKEHAFIEAGGILSESAAWLYSRSGNASDLETALKVARYSFGHRDPSTGLVPNEPDFGRWDSKVCTTEIGLWAQCLLRAGSHTANDEFITMAQQAVGAYLAYAYDPSSGMYAGQVNVNGGEPVIPETTGYWPRKYANPWNTDQWPAHDYPVALAEACLSLHALTGDTVFLDATHRWARIIRDTSPAQNGSWTYAENYGRCIHFLTRAGLELGEQCFIDSAQQLAEEAMEQLLANGMFQGYPKSDVYESVDGVGYLFLSLLYLGTRRAFDYHGFGF